MTTSYVLPQQCSVDGCEKKRRTRGLCPMHYARLMKRGDTGSAQPEYRKRGAECSVAGCSSPVRSRGYCDRHYRHAKQRGETSVRETPSARTGPCSVEGCEADQLSRGYCARHYQRNQWHGTPGPSGLIYQRGSCSVEGCSSPSRANGLCNMHDKRVRSYGAPGGASRIGRVSQPERAMATLVESLGVRAVSGSRKVLPGQKELDIYIPEKKIAIEFNGNYWHSEGRVGRDYHRAKYAACKELGIQLIQVWEDEWRDRREVVEAMLCRKIVGTQAPAVGARKVTVADLTKAEADAFLAATHIQGGMRGSHYVGLVHDGAVVAVGVFLRRNDGQVELSRYASAATVHGGLSKMMKHVGPGHYVTFADHCVSDGGLYERTGWAKAGELAPDYRYLVAGQRVHKFNYRLKRFRDDPALLWEDGLTERELAALNSLDRIYDAGKTRYTKTV